MVQLLIGMAVELCYWGYFLVVLGCCAELIDVACLEVLDELKMDGSCGDGLGAWIDE